MSQHELQPRRTDRRAFFGAMFDVAKAGGVAKAIQAVESSLPTITTVAAGVNLIAEARQARVAQAAGCKDTVSSIDLCPPEGRTPRAGIIIKAVGYDNLNGKPGFQQGEDRYAEHMTGWRYRLENTADARQVAEAIVDDEGELIDLQTGSNLFVFEGNPNGTDKEQGRPALGIKIQRRNAFDRTLNRAVELGDAVVVYSAVDCLPLQNLVLTNKDYLVTPTPAPTPTKSEFVPPTPVVTPTPRVPVVKVPVQLPRTGGTEPAQRPLEELSEAERKLIEQHPAVPRQ